ncbi:hypothetical protein EON67_12255, partial [archaeon]
MLTRAGWLTKKAKIRGVHYFVPPAATRTSRTWAPLCAAPPPAPCTSTAAPRSHNLLCEARCVVIMARGVCVHAQPRRWWTLLWVCVWVALASWPATFASAQAPPPAAARRSSIPSEECATAERLAECGGGGEVNSSMISPSWCSANNPLIVAQPPSKLANASRDMPAYTREYECDGTEPNSVCRFIDNFIALELPVGTVGNITGTKKLVVV